jgi:hypothetical protein
VNVIQDYLKRFKFVGTIHLFVHSRQIDNGMFNFGSGFAWGPKLMEEFGLGSMSVADGLDLVATNMRDFGHLPLVVVGQ